MKIEFTILKIQFNIENFYRLSDLKSVWNNPWAWVSVMKCFFIETRKTLRKFGEWGRWREVTEGNETKDMVIIV